MPKQTAFVRALVFIGMGSTALTGFQEISVAQNTSGLVAFPSTVNFTIPYPQASASPGCASPGLLFPSVFIEFNGAAVTITGVSSSTGGNPNWLQPLCIVTFYPDSGVYVGLSLTGLPPGNYVGSLTIVTTAGTIVVPVNLTYTTAIVCYANAGVSTPARFESLSEFVGDFTANCAGGTPTASGSPIPAADIQVSLNTSLTSRLLSGTWSEALLLMDEPGPQTQRICGTSGDTETSPGVCSMTGNGTGANVYSGTVGRPNVFQGRQTGPNTITFSGVPIDPPGASGSRVLRVTNIRANANALPLAPINATPTSITEAFFTSLPADSLVFAPVSFSFPPGLPSNAGSVAFMQQGISFSQSVAPSFSQCSSQNKSLADDPSQPGASQFNVSFQENFATVLKKRNVASQNNLVVGTYNTESWFYNPAFPTFPGRGALGLAGLADAGTRLLVKFQGIPVGVSLFSPISPTVSGGPDVLRLTATDSQGAGAFSPIAGNASGIVPIPLSGGSGTAVYEVIQSDPNTFATVTIPIYAAYDSTVGLPALGTGVIYTALAPLSGSLAADATSPVPRFGVLSSSSNAFSINACACASDMSASIAVTRGGFSVSFATGRFQQNVTIRNTGPSFIAGPISLALDNLSSNATLFNAAGLSSCAAPSGAPFINVNVGSGLAPGASANVVLQFTRTGSAPFTYSTRVLAGSGGR